MIKNSPYYHQTIKVLQGSTLFNGVDKETMEELLSHFAPTTLPKVVNLNIGELKKEGLIDSVKGESLS